MRIAQESVMHALGLVRIFKNAKSTLLETESVLAKLRGTKLQRVGIDRVGNDRMGSDRVIIDL